MSVDDLLIDPNGSLSITAGEVENHANLFQDGSGWWREKWLGIVRSRMKTITSLL
jgi:hypothetical protein